MQLRERFASTLLIGRILGSRIRWLSTEGAALRVHRGIERNRGYEPPIGERSRDPTGAASDRIGATEVAPGAHAEFYNPNVSASGSPYSSRMASCIS